MASEHFPRQPIASPVRQHHDVVRQGEDCEPSLDARFSTTGSMQSSAASSSQGSADYSGDEDELELEELLREAPLNIARLDCAVNEVAVNLWHLIPPRNFGRVLPGVYRSAYPQPENYNFLKMLGLKTVLTLVPDPYPALLSSLMTENGIKHVCIGIAPNKDPFLTIPSHSMISAVSVVLNPANHPILIHCNKGKHRTGCVVGCLRKTLGWSLPRVSAEYRHYTRGKSRVLDERFMEAFDERALLRLAGANGSVESVIVDPVACTLPGAAGLPNTTRLRG